MLRFDDAARTLDLGVGDVLDLGPRRGSLRLHATFATRARLAAGVEAHQAWQAGRGAEDSLFSKEVTIKHRMVVLDWEVTITGRIDGLTLEGHTWVVEELKSTAMDADRLAQVALEHFPSYRDQLVLYLHFMEAQHKEAVGRLVMWSLADGTRRAFQVSPEPGRGERLKQQLAWVITEHEEGLAWMAKRRGATVHFPHEAFRPGQEQLTEAVEAGLFSGRQVLLQAPTGLGKTAAVLHAALRVAYQTDRRVFFATARTTQQLLALSTLQLTSERGTPLRAVGLRAREKVCLNDVVACRPEACRHADGYHDKVREGDVVQQLLDGGLSTPEVVIEAGRQHTVCPFAVSMEVCDRADVVVGDYNYVFDPAVRLSRFFSEQPERWIVVVDEAHNLPDRARAYGSPELAMAVVEAALIDGGDRYAPFRDLAVDVRRFLDELSAFHDDNKVALPLDDLDVASLRDFAERADALSLDYALVVAQAPVFERDETDPWVTLARALIRFRAVIERAGEETIAIVSPEGLALFCRDPSGILGPTLASLGASVCMSATLQPHDFTASQLGLNPERTAVERFGSPFPADNRKVLVVPDVSTEYRHRDRDRGRTAEHISAICQAVPGNVAVFFPSFAFLSVTRPHLALGDRPVIVQQRAMNEADRARVLSEMARGEGHILLGVLGGIFSEGIDLPGRGLFAAVIVGPALPPVGLERKVLRAWYQERYGRGAFYAFVQPGMTRVIQAAGRVIRTAEDRGAIVLVGRRFLQNDFVGFFPDGWSPIRTREPAPELSGFWEE